MSRGRTGNLRVNTVAQALPLLSGYGLNLLATPLVVTQLGLPGFGVWAMTGALAQYGALFDLGVTRSVMRYVAFHHARDEPDAEREVLGVAVLMLAAVGLVLFATCWLLAPAILSLIRAADVEQLRTLLICAVTILLAVLSAKVLVAAAFGRGRMVAGNAALAVQSTLTVLGGAGYLLTTGSTLSGFGVASAAGAAAGTAIVALVMKVTEGTLSVGWPNRARAREVLSFGVKGQATLVADLVVFQSDKLVIGAIAGPAFAGAYELGNRLALGLRALGGLVSNSLTPSLTASYSQRGLPAILEQYAHLTRRAAGVALIFPFAGIALAPALVPAWLGYVPEYTVVVVIALCIAFAANLTTGVATVVAAAIGRPGITAQSAAVSCVLNVAAVVPAAVVFGVTGVVAATIFAAVGGAAFGIWITHRALRLPLSVFTGAVGGVIVVGGAWSCGIGAILELVSPQSRADGAFTLAAAGAVYLAGYLAIGFQLRFLPALRVRSGTPV